MARGPKAVPSTDRLYQLPLSEFIAARNAMAKDAGADAAAVRALQKPNLPAWAVNQLYWRQRRVYDALVGRAEDLRATHLATLRGKRADLRGAGKEHEAAVEAALKATLALLAEEGQPVTDATKQAIATTLRGLPGDEPAGRLTRPLEPRGFEMLTGAASGGTVRLAARPAAPPAPPTSKARPGPKADKPDKASQAAAKARAREKIAEAREALTSASRTVRIAEQTVRREEFEAARAARDADKAQRRVADAEAAVAAAQTALEEAEREATAAKKERDEAQDRAAAAAADLEAARDHEKRARADLEQASEA